MAISAMAAMESTINPIRKFLLRCPTGYSTDDSLPPRHHNTAPNIAVSPTMNR